MNLRCYIWRSMLYSFFINSINLTHNLSSLPSFLRVTLAENSWKKLLFKSRGTSVLCTGAEHWCYTSVFAVCGVTPVFSLALSLTLTLNTGNTWPHVECTWKIHTWIHTWIHSWIHTWKYVWPHVVCTWKIHTKVFKVRGHNCIMKWMMQDTWRGIECRYCRILTKGQFHHKIPFIYFTFRQISPLLLAYYKKCK